MLILSALSLLIEISRQRSNLEMIAPMEQALTLYISVPSTKEKLVNVLRGLEGLEGGRI
jgi:hypothetical protein